MLIEKVELKKLIFNNGNSFMAKFMARQWQNNLSFKYRPIQCKRKSSRSALILTSHKEYLSTIQHSSVQFNIARTVL